MLIVFEGIDGSGKTTVSRLLADKLSQDTTIPVRLLSYPNYLSPTGDLINRYLHGTIDFKDDMDNTNPYGVAALYALDHLQYYEKSWKKCYRNRDIIICDRYTISNLYYSPVTNPSLKTREQIERFQKNIIRMEHMWMGLPYPDITFYLDMNPETCTNLRKERGKEEDIYESDIEFLNNVNEQGKKLMNWFFIQETFNPKIISCMDSNGQLKSPQQILDEILGILNIDARASLFAPFIK